MPFSKLTKPISLRYIDFTLAFLWNEKVTRTLTGLVFLNCIYNEMEELSEHIAFLIYWVRFYRPQK